MENPMVKLAHAAPENIKRHSFKAYRGQHNALEKIQQKNGKKMTLHKVDYTQYYAKELRNAKDVRYIVNIES